METGKSISPAVSGDKKRGLSGFAWIALDILWVFCLS